MLKSFDAPLHRTVVQISNREIPFFHRGSEDDIGIIAQTFEHRQYYPNAERFLDLELEYEKIVASNKIPLIIDAGANIGTSTVWFAENYPLSHIVSIEPDSNNFKTLAFNVANYFVDCRAAAIASVDGVGYLHDPGRGLLGM